MRQGLCIVVLLGLATPAGADDLPLQLRGLEKVEFLVANLDDDARKCGLEEKALQNSLTLPIQSFTKIRGPQGAAPHAVAVLEVTVIDTPQMCISNIHLQINTFKFVQLPFGSQPGAQTIELWDRGRLIAGPRNALARMVGENIDLLAKDFSAAWQKANP